MCAGAEGMRSASRSAVPCFLKHNFGEPTHPCKPCLVSYISDLSFILVEGALYYERDTQLSFKRTLIIMIKNIMCQSCLSVRSLLAASGSSARHAPVTAAKWMLGGPPVTWVRPHVSKKSGANIDWTMLGD